jgi:hypothetical protein
MLGFGELFAHEAAFRLGWGGTKVSSAPVEEKRRYTRVHDRPGKAGAQALVIGCPGYKILDQRGIELR